MRRSASVFALFAGLLVTAVSAFASPSCPACAAPTAPAAPAAEVAPATAPALPAGHPLRGVVLEVMPAKQALLVDHEAIQGFMRAMTMLLKVDAPTLVAAQKGQTITATLYRLEDGWWLRDVTVVP